MLMIDQDESEDFLVQYELQFHELQATFLSLLKTEINHYGDDKDMVNPDILKNLVEVLNMQILLKLAQKKKKALNCSGWRMPLPLTSDSSPNLYLSHTPKKLMARFCAKKTLVKFD